MTEFTIRLRVEGTLSRGEAYTVYGEIAEAVTAIHNSELVEITDDCAPVVALPPTKPRKPRGKNKPKVTADDVRGILTPPSQGAAPSMPIPDSLKRTAE